MTLLLLRASARHLRQRPWQLLLAITGIALGVAVATAVDLANDSALRAYRLSMDSVTGSATHQIVGGPAGLDERIYTRLRLNGLRATAPLIEAYGVTGGETLHVVGIDPLADGPFRRHTGTDAQIDLGALIATPATALLAQPTAERLGLAAGDTFELSLGGRSHTVRLLGLIATDAGNRAAIDGLLVVDIATAQELTATHGRLSWIDVKLAQDARGRAEEETLRRLLPPEATLLPAASRTQATEQMSRSFHVNLTAMSLLALVVGMFLIYNTMSFAVVQRRAHLAIERLIGVTRRELLAVVLIEAGAIGAVATALGLSLGALLAQGLLELVSRTINDHYFVLTVRAVELAPATFVKAALLGLGATLASSLPPALEAALTSPRSALARSTLEARSHRLMPRLALAGAGAMTVALVLLLLPGGSLAAGFAGLFLLIIGMSFATPLITAWLTRILNALLPRRAGVSWRLALRGITDALSRTGVALAALMLAIAATVGVDLMIGSFRATVVDWLESTLQADIYVSAPGSGSRRTAGRLDPALVEHLVRLPEIAHHTTGRRVSLESEQGFTEIFVFGPAPGITPRYRLKAGDPDRVWPAFLRGEVVLLSETLAWRRGLAAGDRIELRTDTGPHAFPVAGLYYDYSPGQGDVLMPRALYERHFSDRAVSGLGLYLRPGADPEAALGAIRDAVALAGPAQPASVRSNRELRALSLAVFDRTFSITEVLRLLAVLVAVIGILGALMALQLERGAELGVLRALGFTPGQIRGLILLQTGAMGLIAGLIALPTGLLLGGLLIHVINRRSFGWSMQTVVPAETLLAGLATAVLAAFAAGLYPAWRMSRTPPAAALREA